MVAWHDDPLTGWAALERAIAAAGASLYPLVTGTFFFARKCRARGARAASVVLDARFANSWLQLLDSNQRPGG
jgi:hypothetical protein